MNRRINAEGLSHIKKFEGLETRAYRDVANILTIGYGHTSAAGAPEVRRRNRSFNLTSASSRIGCRAS